MIKYSVKDFNDALVDIGIQKGDILIIHNSLFSFGIPLDIPLKNLPEEIFKILIDIIGDEGTIAVPTFNFDYCKRVPFNRQTTPPKLMGNFSEYVFLLPNSRRSFHPMQPISAVGKYAEELTKHDTISSFSDNGPWATLEKLNAKVLLLGSSFNSPSIVHRVEENEQVPYRYWKSFEGEYIDGEEVSHRQYKMYVRDHINSPTLNFTSLEKDLMIRGQLKKHTIGGGFVMSVTARDLIDLTTEKIRNNPYYFVSNHEKYLRIEG